MTEELLKQYNLNKEEVLKWGKENFPEYVNNLTLITKLYLHSKGIKIPPKRTPTGAVIPISEIEPDTWTNISGIISQVVEERTYKGCPQCLKKTENTCERHNLKAVELTWRTYEIGDATGNIMIVLSPRTPEPLEVGDKIMCRGILDSEREVFRVFQLEVQKSSISPTSTPSISPTSISPISEEKTIETLAEILPEEKSPVPTPTPSTPTPPTPTPPTPLGVDIENLIKFIKVSAMMGKSAKETEQYLEKLTKKLKIEVSFPELLEKAGVTITPEGNLRI